MSTDLALRIALHFAAILHLRRDAAISLEANYKVRIAGILSGMLITLLIVASVACSDAADKEDLKPTVVDALDALAEDLASDRPADADAYAERLQVYLEEHPTFFGSAAALLDPSGEVIAAPTSIARPTATAWQTSPRPPTASRSRTGSQVRSQQTLVFGPNPTSTRAAAISG